MLTRQELAAAALAAASMSMSATAAHAAVETFRSRAQSGSMDEHYRVTITRECIDTKNAPHVKCVKQEITISDKKGKVMGRFDAAAIARQPDGTLRANIANVWVIEEDHGGGDGMRYFMLRFVPQDDKDIDVLGNGGQIFPRYFQIVTDGQLRPLPGMRLSQGSATDQWLDRKRKESARNLKAQKIEQELTVKAYVEVMPDR